MPGSPQFADSPQQLWLDVQRPLQPRPRRAPVAPPEPAAKAPPRPVAQMELRMAVAPPAAATAGSGAVPAPVPAATVAPLCFAAWLLGQVARPGTLGELAKAAKLDRLYPKNGTADDVRARFAAAGADGDAFAALDDAECAFDRQMG